MIKLEVNYSVGLEIIKQDVCYNIQTMQEIKWLPLRLNIIPLIDKQTRQVLSIFLKIKD